MKIRTIILLGVSLFHAAINAGTVNRTETITAGDHDVMFTIDDVYEFELWTQQDQKVTITPPKKHGWSPGSEAGSITIGECENSSPQQQLFIYNASVDQLAADAFDTSISGDILCSPGSGTGSGSSDFTYNLKTDLNIVFDPPELHLLVGQSVELKCYGEDSSYVLHEKTVEWLEDSSGYFEFRDPEDGELLSSKEERTRSSILVKAVAEGETTIEISEGDDDMGGSYGVNLDLSDLKFMGAEFGNDETILTDEGENVFGPTDQFDWGDSNFDGTPDVRNPLRFPVNSKMKVGAVFLLTVDSDIDPKADGILVMAEGPDGIKVGAAQDITPSFVKHTVEGVEKRYLVFPLKPADDGSEFGDDVKIYKNFKVTFKISFDNRATWRPIGESDNLVYLTNQSFTDPVYHTVLHTSCAAAISDGDGGIVEKIVSKVNTRRIYKVDQEADEDDDLLSDELLIYHDKDPIALTVGGLMNEALQGF